MTVADDATKRLPSRRSPNLSPTGILARDWTTRVSTPPPRNALLPRARPRSTPTGSRAPARPPRLASCLSPRALPRRRPRRRRSSPARTRRGGCAIRHADRGPTCLVRALRRDDDAPGPHRSKHPHLALARRPRAVRLRAPRGARGVGPRRLGARGRLRLAQGVVPDVPRGLPRPRRAQRDETPRRAAGRVARGERRVERRRGQLPSQDGAALAGVPQRRAPARVPVPRVGVRRRRRGEGDSHVRRRRRREDGVRVLSLVRDVLSVQGGGRRPLGVAHPGRGRVAGGVPGSRGDGGGAAWRTPRRVGHGRAPGGLRPRAGEPVRPEPRRVAPRQVRPRDGLFVRSEREVRADDGVRGGPGHDERRRVHGQARRIQRGEQGRLRRATLHRAVLEPQRVRG